MSSCINISLNAKYLSSVSLYSTHNFSKKQKATAARILLATMESSTFTVLLLLSTFTATFGGEIEVINKCGQKIFVGNHGGKIGGFNLEDGQSQKIELVSDASASVWAHTGCENDGNNCDTAEGYISLAEMHWDDSAGMIGFTWYDISQVDGYNLPITMQPYTNTGGECETVNCNFNMDADCPTESRIYKGDRVVACQNPNKDTDDTDYSRALEASCKNVYTWSYDTDGMRSCQPGNNGLIVTFC